MQNAETGVSGPAGSSASGEPTAAAPDRADDEDIGRLSSRRTLALNCLALLVVLLAGVAVIHNGYIAVPDEGVYSAQAENLAAGSWESARPAPDLDPEGVYDGLVPGFSAGDVSVPHHRNPLYPAILGVSYRIGGTVGLLLASAVAVWIAATATALVARRLRPAVGVPALWLSGLGTPLVFSAAVVLGHALAAAACALLLLSLAAALDGRQLRWLALTVLSVVVLVSVRSEGVIVAAAAGITVLAAAVPRPGRRRADRPGLVAGVTVLATAAVAYRFTSWWTSRIVAGASGGGEVAAFAVPPDRDPVTATWIALLRPWDSGLNAEPAAVLVVFSVLLAAVILRFVPRFRALGLGLLAVGALSGVVLAIRPPYLITGLLPAFPLLVAVVFLGRTDLRRPSIARLTGIAVLSGAGILLTIYSDGGSTQWGGRFLHVLIPALVPLVVVGLDHARVRLEPREALFAAACVLVATASMTTVAVRANLSNRDRFERLVSETRSILSEGDGRQLVIYAPLSSDGGSRGFWAERDEVAVLRPGDLRLLFPLVGTAAEAGVDRIVVVSTVAAPSLRIFDRGVMESIGWEFAEDIEVGENYHLVVLQPELGEQS